MNPGAVVAIWNGVTDAGRADFYRWHETEHMPERVGIPGFLRGRRYRSISGAPEFFTRYDLASAAVLTGDAYLARLNDPTPWTSRVLPHFRDTARALCNVAFTAGQGDRAWLVTVRLYAQPDGGAALLAKIAESAAGDFPATIRVLETDDAASAAPTSERKSRPPDQAFPRYVLLAETRNLDIAEDIEGALLRGLAGVGVSGAVSGIYVLEFDLS